MSTITKETIIEILSRDHVQRYLNKRERKPGCVECGVEVPILQDGSFFSDFYSEFCDPGFISKMGIDPRPKFIEKNRHPKGNPCRRESLVFQLLSYPEGELFRPDFVELYNIILSNPIINRQGQWVLT